MIGAAQSRYVFLIGFMAAGKSTVGPLAADLLGLEFIDLDQEIERAQGKPIGAIFAERGEQAFRELEAEALEQIMSQGPKVVATGGGTPCHGHNLARMRERGLVLALTAPLDVLIARVDDPTTRPLLMRPDHEIRDLFAARMPLYRQAHACLGTEDVLPGDLARTIAQMARAARTVPDDMLAHTILVALAERTYPVIAAPGSLERVGELCRLRLDARCARVAVISDSNVAPLHGERARLSLAAAGFATSEHVVPAGEGAKSFAEYERISEELVAAGLDRGSAIIALGGGVVGDLAGLVAATLFRGIACVQVPTTLLAMVDSAIGGKTGINLAAGKNLIGVFWQPRLVLADPLVLATLPAREARAAFGELVKYALLDGEDLYAAVEALAPSLSGSLARGTPMPDLLTEVIRRAAAIKSWIVSRDEHEQTGERALLNLGHTIGHAIEAAAGYGELLHGEAVALGLIAACRVSARLGLCDAALEKRVAATLCLAGLDVDLDPWLHSDVIQHVKVDKKRTGRRIDFITVSEVGRCTRTAVDLDELVRLLRL